VSRGLGDVYKRQPLIQYVANKVQRGEGVTGDSFSALIKAYYEDKNEINAETLDLTAISSLNQLFGSSINQLYVREFYLKYRNRQGQNIAHLLPVEQLEGLSKALDYLGIIYLMSSKDFSRQTPVEKASLTESEVYRKLMSSVAEGQSDGYLDREEDVNNPFSARAVEARVVLTAQSLEGADLNPSLFETVWRSPYFDKRSGKAIDHEDFVNVIITMARLKADKGGADAAVPLAFLQENMEHKEEAKRLWKSVLEEHDRFLDAQKDTFQEEYRKAQEERTMSTGHRVLKFVSNGSLKFPGDETRVKMASKLIATGGVFGLRSKRLDKREAATLVEACEKVAYRFVRNLMGQSVRPRTGSLEKLDEHIAEVEVFLGQVNEVIRKDVGNLVLDVWGGGKLDFELIKQEHEEHKVQLLAERVVLEAEEKESKQQHFIQTFKHALVKLKDIFLSEGLPSEMSLLPNRVLNHQRTCTVVSMFSVLKGLEAKDSAALDTVLQTVAAPSASPEDRMFNCIDEIFASSELGVAPAKTSRQLFTSACRHLDPNFEFSFGRRAGDYVAGSLHTVLKPLGGDADRGFE
jgi:hypothetical protein